MYVRPVPNFMKHFPFKVLFQFASNGVVQKHPMRGSIMLNAVTIRIEAHITVRYMRENFSDRRRAHMEYFNNPTARMFNICPIQRKYTYFKTS